MADNCGQGNLAPRRKVAKQSLCLSGFARGSDDHSPLTTHSSPPLTTHQLLQARAWQSLSTAGEPDAVLIQDLQRCIAETPEPASLHNDLGVLAARNADLKRSAELSETAIEHFRRAVGIAPGHVVAGLNLAEAWAAAGRKQEAIEQARCLLASLDQGAK